MSVKKEVKELLVMSLLAGRIMLKNGAETFRVEDTIIRLCKSRFNIKYAEAFVTPTGIFLSVEYEDDIISYIYRITTIKFDLNKIALVNDFSRKFVNSNMPIKDGHRILKDIDKSKTYSTGMKLIFGGIAGGFFSLLFGGQFFDLLGAFIISVAVVFLTDYLSKANVYFFLRNILGGILVTILSIIFSKLVMQSDMNKLIIGAIMPLVPGVAITNAIRDSISGDFLSGMSRGLEALIIAFSIAFGVGITLRIYFTYFGGF
ncbi:threonine/serine exporter family protein [Dethiothermospora halolimnae]|uniref:threonine/serine exporter family protein n=1 Tax=Dethiothermospora halolimnae TaxID=3114390 RepID=UPI003CCB9CD7